MRLSAHGRPAASMRFFFLRGGAQTGCRWKKLQYQCTNGFESLIAMKSIGDELRRAFTTAEAACIPAVARPAATPRA
jgi:hypothetical protein